MKNDTNDTIEKIEEEITKKTTMPNDLKEKLRKEIFLNILLAIAIIVYFVFMVLGSLDSAKVTRSIDLNIFSIVLLAISIILIEVAYKKESAKIAVTAIEILIVSVVTMFLPYIIYELDKTHQRYYIISGVAIAFYYIIKSIVISNRAKAKYEKNESDIKDITKKEFKEIKDTKKPVKEKKKEVKETKPKAKKESKKENKKEDKIEDKIEKPIGKKTEKKANVNATKPSGKAKKVEEKPEENIVAPKKRGRPRKETNTTVTIKEEKIAKKSPKESATKKPTEKKNTKTTKTLEAKTTKATKTTKEAKTTAKTTTKTKKQEEVAPKKRGRPRKVVSK